MTKNTLADVGGRFMSAPEIRAAGEAIGLPGSTLYFRGRMAALGEVNAAAAIDIMGIFSPGLIEHLWQKSAGFPTEKLVAAYTEACAVWGRNHLVELSNPERLVELASRVADHAAPSSLALFGAWRAVARPADVRGNAAFLLMLLRELRGGLHFAALAVQGVDIPSAIIVDQSSGGPERRLVNIGWRAADIESLKQNAAQIPGLEDRWAAAEELTEAAYQNHLAVLSDAERAELDQLIIEAEQVSRISGVT